MYKITDPISKVVLPILLTAAAGGIAAWYWKHQQQEDHDKARAKKGLGPEPRPGGLATTVIDGQAQRYIGELVDRLARAVNDPALLEDPEMRRLSEILQEAEKMLRRQGEELELQPDELLLQGFVPPPDFNLALRLNGVLGGARSLDTVGLRYLERILELVTQLDAQRPPAEPSPRLSLHERHLRRRDLRRARRTT